MLLTVVIPVLNGEKYIESCILSVLEQKVKDCEIIVIDSGSTDKTLEIVKYYKNKDKRISVVHTSKKSYGAQVNIGIDQAQGKYLAILEADDLLPENAYVKMIKKIEETNSDIVKGNYDFFITTADGMIISSTDGVIEDLNIYEKVTNARRDTNILRKDRYLWRAVYSVKFIRHNHIRLNETPGAAFQDTGFLMQTLILAKRVVYIKDSVYLYRKDNELSSVYNSNGMKYIADEFEYVNGFLEKLSEEEQIIYKPLVCLTMMDMVRTRCLQRGLMKDRWECSGEVIERIQIMLKKEGEYLGRDERNQKDLYEVNLFLNNYNAYLDYTRDEILAEQEDVNRFFEKIQKYQRIVIWGCGRTGNFLRMLLAKRKIAAEIILTDKNRSEELNIFSPEEMEINDDGNTIYVICAVNSRYKIREDLHERYRINYNNILLYTLGTSQNLLLMHIREK